MEKRPDLSLLAMTKALFALHDQYRSMIPDFSRAGGMPLPRTRLIIPEADRLVPTVELFEGSLQYYPIKIAGIRRSDRLRAFFDCFAEGQPEPFSIRLDRQELAKEYGFLHVLSQKHKNDSLLQWNMMQIKVAQAFMQCVSSDKRRGIRDEVVESFHAPREEFREKFFEWGATLNL